MRVNIVYAFVTLLLSGLACSKVVSIIKAVPNTSLTVVNAVDGSNALLTTFWSDSSVGSFYNTAQQIYYGSSAEYNFQSESTPVIIYQGTDTAAPFFNGLMTFQPNGVYSFFLSGELNIQNAPDTLLVQDAPLYHPPGDSAVGIRFVNVSPGTGVISVDIMGNPPGSEVSSLPYQGVTAFKDYPSTATVPDPSVGYVFEFRSVSTGNLLTTFYYGTGSQDRFRNVSIVLSGSPAGSGIQAFQVDNY